MNTFGRLFSVSILGESHGKCVGVLIDGCSAGLDLEAGDFTIDLERRRSGRPGTTARREDDIPSIMTGFFNGKTTGAPLLILIENKDVDSDAYEQIRTRPRPGHADLVAFQKFGGFNDYRGGGTFSGRLTAALVAAGVVAKKLLSPLSIQAQLVEVGGSTKIESAIEDAIRAGDSIGGIVQCKIEGVPAGLGEPFFDSVESLLSHLIFSIPGIKGIEFGTGFACSTMTGSHYNDAILTAAGKTRTNNAGGVSGGISNGNEILLRVAVKPTSSISKAQQTIDVETGLQQELTISGRHDACIALRVPVIVEAACAIVIADLMMIEQKIPRVLRR
ncbi:MAG TPA: chorismate synthase [Syntrophorhabdales bacterium]|nr:chorismate synthase [Syntrophorhabdales bacterium]